MDGATTLQDLLEREAIRQLMADYASACDRRDAVALAACFTQDIELLTPGVPALRGPGTAGAVITTLSEMFALTQHLLHNGRYKVDGDSAEGETYCTAIHIFRPADDGRQLRLDWGIRYLDGLRKEDGNWRLRRRELVIDWTDRRTLSP